MVGKSTTSALWAHLLAEACLAACQDEKAGETLKIAGIGFFQNTGVALDPNPEGEMLPAAAARCCPTRTYLKNSLSGHGGVMKRLKMRTYHMYAALFRRCMPFPEP
ncbi:MAG: hypothetical protein KQI81_04420 [Deltaproteobacteria bacterium]|nr:hypothetical protein [Deltaproteobacteria bacterium]